MRLETGPGSLGSERDQWSEDPGVGETCCNVYTADTAVTTGRPDTRDIACCRFMQTLATEIVTKF